MTKQIGRLPTGYTEFDITREFDEDPKKDQKRSAFEVDKARILHSASFRRLQGKTQVIGAGERDFYRTRLTHSLEVAQIGRGFCQELNFPADYRIDADLVETICLAHDIGHPPFGHTGEDHLHRLMLTDGGFGANPQNIRIVRSVEVKSESSGLNLTRATLDGLMKYKTVFDPERHTETSKFLYKEHEPLLDWVATDKELGVEITAAAHEKSLEADIADWSDTIAYSVNDVEDNIRAGLFDLVRMSKKIAEIHEIAQKRDPSLTEKDVEVLAVQMGKALLFDPQTERDRKVALKRWSSTTITDLMSDTSIKEADGSKVSPRYAFQLQRGDAAVRKTAILKAAASVLVFGNPSVSTLEYKGVTILGKLFEYLIDDPKLLPYDFRELIRENGDQTRRLVADFISGMTDTYAQNYYSRLTTPGVGSFYEHI